MAIKKMESTPDPVPNEDDDEIDPDVEAFANDWGALHSFKDDTISWRDSVEKRLEDMARGSKQSDQTQPGAASPNPQNGQDGQDGGSGRGKGAPRTQARSGDTAPKSEHRWFRRLGG